MLPEIVYYCGYSYPRSHHNGGQMLGYAMRVPPRAFVKIERVVRKGLGLNNYILSLAM